MTSRNAQPTVEALTRSLEKFRKELSVSMPTSEFLATAGELWRFLVSSNEDAAERLSRSDYVEKHSAFFGDMQRRFEHEIEMREAARILSDESFTRDTLARGDGIHRYLYDTYNSVASELQLIDRAGDTLVMIGAGAVPCTVFHIGFSKRFSEIIGLDEREPANAAATRIGERLGLGNVRFEVRNGLEYDYSGVDCVIIGNLVRPKVEVLARVTATADQGAQVLVRLPARLGHLLFEDIPRGPPRRAEIVATSSSNRKLLSRTLLMRIV